MAREEKVSVVITAEARQFQQTMSQVARNAWKSFNSITGNARAAARIFSGALKSGIMAMVGAFAFAVKEGAEFENEMLKTAAVAAGAGGDIGKVFDTLSEKALQMGKDTVFSASEAAKSMYDLASAGFAVDEIMSAIGPTMRFAVAAGGDLSQTTELLGTTLRAFGLQATDTTRVTDVFTKAITASRFTIDRLQNAMKFAGPTGAAFGMTLEETTAIVAQFLNVGLGASQAGTTFRMALTQLTRETKAGGAALERMGLKYKDVNPEVVKFGDILKLVADRSITAREATSLFGVRAGSVIKRVADAIREGGIDIKQFTKDLQNAAGTTDRLYTEMMKSTTNKAKLAWSSASVAAIRFFELVKPFVDVFVEDIGGAFDEITFFLEAAVRQVDGAWQFIKDIVSANFRWLIGQGAVLVDTVTMTLQITQNRVAAWISDILGSILFHVGKLTLHIIKGTGIVVSTVTSAGAKVLKVLAGVVEPVGRFVNNLVKGALTGARVFITGIEGLINQAFMKFSALPTKAKQAIERVFPGVQSTLASMGVLVGGLGKKVDETIAGLHIDRMAKKAAGDIKAAIDTAKKGLDTGFSGALKTVAEKTNAGVAFFKTKAKDLRQSADAANPYVRWAEGSKFWSQQLQKDLRTADDAFINSTNTISAIRQKDRKEAERAAAAKRVARVKNIQEGIDKEKKSIEDLIKDMRLEGKVGLSTAGERLAKLNEILHTQDLIAESEGAIRDERTRAISEYLGDLTNLRNMRLLSTEEHLEQIRLIAEEETLSLNERAQLEEAQRSLRREAYGELFETDINFREQSIQTLVSLGDAWATQFADKAIKSTNKLAGAVKGLLTQLIKIAARKIFLKILGFGGGTSASGVSLDAHMPEGQMAIGGQQTGTGLAGILGPTSGRDVVPALLQPGEIVLNKSASDLFRDMAALISGRMSAPPVQILLVTKPSLLGNREELIRLDQALSGVNYMRQRKTA
jgi:TP901 family phage tail tape measure protein